MTCAIAVSLGKVETCKRMTLTNNKEWVFGRRLGNGVDRPGGLPSVHSATGSNITSKSDDMGNMTVASQVNCSENAGSRFVQVVEACRFVFALALTLDLLLGLFPLLATLLFTYLLPHRAFPALTSAAASGGSSISGLCANAAVGPAAFPGGNLVSSSLMTRTDTFCALHLALFRSLLLVLLVSTVYAALLFTRAARIFIPVETRVHVDRSTR